MYDNEENVCGIIYNGEPYCFRKDLQGDIISITDYFGQEVAKYSYDAWGACTILVDASDDHIASVNPYRYRGYYFDAETGLYYLQSRYYNPVIGRFVNGDESRNAVTVDISLESNLFCYCQCEPVNDKDDNGKISSKKVRKIFKKITKWAKKILGLVKDYIDDRLKLYTGLSPSDISKIASAITVISLVSFVSNAVDSVRRGREVAGMISKRITIGLVELIKCIAGKGIKKLTGLIPGIGVFLSFALSEAIEYALEKIFSNKYVKKVTNKYERKIAEKIRTYEAYQYFVAFVDCWT